MIVLTLQTSSPFCVSWCIPCWISCRISSIVPLKGQPGVECLALENNMSWEGVTLHHLFAMTTQPP